MQIAKNKTAAIAIAIFLMLSMSASMMLIPTASAHTPAWSIPTYAYITAEPDPVGVGQTIQVYAWLDAVYGAAGGTTAVIGTNASTCSAALTANNWRFHNFQVVITAPDGTKETKTWAIVSDPTSSQEFSFTPTQVGTYTFNFTFPGQVYGANGDGYEKSPIFNDTFLPSTASTNLTVQQTPIPAAEGSTPLPTAYWTHPIYGEGTDWWTISSDWLGSGSPVPAHYTSSAIYHGDAVGPLTSHVMWTKPLQFGGVVGGNPFVAGGSTPGNGADQGAQYFEGTSYEPRFVNPIIISGYLFYTEPVSFTGPSSGPTDCVDLRTGQVLWSRSDVPPLSFGYIYNLWNGEQHGTFNPILVAAIGGGFTGLPAMWEVFDAYTGDLLFNVTGVPGFGAQAGQLIAGQTAVALTTATVAGPSGEQLRYVFANDGTSANPQWYLAQWNSSKLWQYDVNPYTGGGSLNPSVINASNLVLVSANPANPITGTTGTIPTPTGGTSIFVPYGSSFTVNANIPINATTLGGEITGLAGAIAGPGITTYDWNVSVPWLNTMPLQPTYNTVTGGTTPAIEQGTATGFLAAGGTNPVTIVSATTGDVMLCRNGSLPSGFMRTYTGYPQLSYTLFAVNLNASRGAIGSILWMKNYDPPAGNLTLAIQGVDFQNRVFIINYGETMQWVGYSLDTGNLLWGPTASQAAFDYYTTSYRCLLAYGNLYSMGYAGICYCYNDLTGKIVFTYGNGGEGNSTNAGLNVFYGDYPTMMESIANGVLYTATSEHTMPNPFYKGCTYRAINATDGTEIWQLSGYPSEWSTPGSEWGTADGYIACMNGLDNNIYSIGRGPSATTVSAPDVGLSFGTPIVIKGTVMDISAGTKQNQQAADFPNGVPCSSDASMKDWMGYVYQQKPLPTNFTGVPVTIDVLDSNGNYRNIGTATTDATGTFRLTWTPDIPGNFTVVATFDGTNGYWPSYAEDGFNVMQAPAATTAPTPTPASMADLYFLPVSVAIIIAIVIVGAVLALLMLRKRP
jgi:hypothetical protein